MKNLSKKDNGNNEGAEHMQLKSHLNLSSPLWYPTRIEIETFRGEL